MKLPPSTSIWLAVFALGINATGLIYSSHRLADAKAELRAQCLRYQQVFKGSHGRVEMPASCHEYFPDQF